MGNNAVKTIVLVMVLVVLSIVVGAQVSDGMKASFGAFATIGAIAVMFVMLLLGVNSWRLIFFAPPLLAFFAYLLPGGFPLDQIAIIALGVYWVLMSLMGYVRFRVRFLPFMDVFVLALTLYMAVSFYKHPVSINALGMDGDMVGGKDYFTAVCAVLAYVVLSVLPWQLESLLKCLKWAFYFGLVMALIASLRGMMSPQTLSVGGDEVGASEVLEKGRFAFFVVPGMMTLVYVYFRYPLGEILLSRWKMLAFTLGALSLIMSGWRTRLVYMLVNLSFVAVVKREMTVLIVCGLFAYVGLFCLGSAGAFEDAPYGLQRVLSAVPGVAVSKAASMDTSGSSEIRIKMWRRALDPSTGLIRDYIWGDGFQSSKSAIDRDNTARMRGKFIDQQYYMEQQGSWHNGWITYLHRLGLVGLVLIQTFMLVCVGALLRLGRALRHVPDGAFGFMAAYGFLPISLTSAFLVFTLTSYFAVFTSVALLKVLYCLMLERGYLTPMLSRQQYVPMTIREMQQRAVNY